jgi:hypothetical protein
MVVAVNNGLIPAYPAMHDANYTLFQMILSCFWPRQNSRWQSFFNLMHHACGGKGHEVVSGENLEVNTQLCEI